MYVQIEYGPHIWLFAHGFAVDDYNDEWKWMMGEHGQMSTLPTCGVLVQFDC